MLQLFSSLPKSARRVTAGAFLMTAFALVLSADTATFYLGPDPSHVYDTVNVGPYSGTLTGSDSTIFFCLDLNKTANFKTSYTGTTAPPATQSEDEAAFLAAYLLNNAPPRSDPHFVLDWAGPVSFAIWQLMGSLGGASQDSAAQYYVTLAEQAYQGGSITPAFLNDFLIFTPGTDGLQRFLTANPKGVPEPASWLLLATGALAAWATRRWWLCRAA